MKDTIDDGTVQLRWRPERGGDVTVVARARGWLHGVLPRLVGRHPRRDLYDDTELLLCELVTNAVVHGGGVTGVRLQAAERTLRVTVCDHTAAEPVAGVAGGDAEHGRGLMLIEMLATRWGTDRGGAAGKCVWFELSTD
jgi:anti-sigma regulatory factor (Ser/Thr protein kinase)